MDLWIATTNKGKLSEFKSLLSELKIQVHSPAELSFYASPPETGTSFQENARIKAKTIKALKPKTWVLGEDSGLEAEGLGGLPGIHSARYAGPKASDAENTAKLLKMMSLRSANNRKARYVCSIVIYDPDGNEYLIEEYMNGEIAKKQAGSNGFGYDPVFIPEGETKTVAELPSSFKAQNSHRAKALKGCLKYFKS